MARSSLHVFIRQCLHKRVEPVKFEELLSYASKERKWTSAAVIASLVKCNYEFCIGNDPLVPLYIQILVTQARVQPSEILTALISHWRLTMTRADADLLKYARQLARTLTDFTLVLSDTSLSEDESRRSIVLAARWVLVLCRLVGDKDIKIGNEQINDVNEAVALLLLTLIRSVVGDQVLRSINAPKEDVVSTILHETIEASMETFPNISVQLMESTEKYSSLFASSQTDKVDEHEAGVAVMQFQGNITDTPIMPARGATYVYLYNMLVTSSTIDDTALCNYLGHRHAGNHTLIFNDLITSSFDALTKPVEASQELYNLQCRVFLHNKLPVILAYVLQMSTFGPLPTEQLLLNLWNDLSARSDQNTLAIARHFLHVCSLHHLISTEATEMATGESAGVDSAKGLFSKDSLIDQVSTNASRGPRLIDELRKNDGNAGTISYALLETMHRYCQSKETHHLKDIANAIVRKPDTINVMAMFASPNYILAAICKLLDEWVWQDNHGESQAAYEEFGSLLMLVLVFRSKLNLRDDQLGIASNSGFLVRYLSSEGISRDYVQMSVNEQKHLGDWIEALFFADTGLTDELFSACDPRDFYIMVPSLLDQSMHALKAGKLSEDSLRNNLEYLLEPSLLPALLTALSWLVTAVGKDPKHATTVARVLTKSPENADTKGIHQTVLMIAQSNMRASLPRTTDISHLSNFFSLFGSPMNVTVKHDATPEEKQLWTSGPGGIGHYLQKAVSGLLSGGSTDVFSHNLLLASSRLCGPKDIVHSLLMLLIQFSTSTEFGQLLDLVSTIIAATDSSGVTLRAALQLRYTQLGRYLQKGENLYAEALVHLTRRVELYATALTPQAMNLVTSLLPLNDAEVTNINLDSLTATDPVVTQQSLEEMPQDTMMPTDETFNQMLDEAVAMGNVDELDASMNDMNDFDFTTDNYDLDDLNELDLNMF